jgi:lipoic acid synthetase
VEVLVPDFRGRLEKALEILGFTMDLDCLTTVMNDNLETVPRLYKEARPGADYSSLKLLKDFKELYPNIPTKSGLMVGLGGADEEILEVMRRDAAVASYW